MLRLGPPYFDISYIQFNSTFGHLTRYPALKHSSDVSYLIIKKIDNKQSGCQLGPTYSGDLEK